MKAMPKAMPRAMMTITLLAALVPITAEAQQQTGNGGHALVCRASESRSSAILHARLLDYKLGEGFGRKAYFGAARTTREKVNLGVERLSRLSQNLSLGKKL
jgi:hypothetical protein